MSMMPTRPGAAAAWRPGPPGVSRHTAGEPVQSEGRGPRQHLLGAPGGSCWGCGWGHGDHARPLGPLPCPPGPARAWTRRLSSPLIHGKAGVFQYKCLLGNRRSKQTQRMKPRAGRLSRRQWDRHPNRGAPTRVSRGARGSVAAGPAETCGTFLSLFPELCSGSRSRQRRPAPATAPSPALRRKLLLLPFCR